MLLVSAGLLSHGKRSSCQIRLRSWVRRRFKLVKKTIKSPCQCAFQTYDLRRPCAKLCIWSYSENLRFILSWLFGPLWWCFRTASWFDQAYSRVDSDTKVYKYPTFHRTPPSVQHREFHSSNNTSINMQFVSSLFTSPLFWTNHGVDRLLPSSTRLAVKPAAAALTRTSPFLVSSPSFNYSYHQLQLLFWLLPCPCQPGMRLCRLQVRRLVSVFSIASSV